MHHQQLPQQQQPNYDVRLSKMTQKCLLIYKLLLLENARSEVEQKLHDFTYKASEEVHTFLKLTLPTGQYYDVIRTLDVKRQALERLLALLEDIINDPQISVNTSTKSTFVNENLHLVNVKGVLSSNMLPMLQNFSMVSSISKAVQMVGSTLMVGSTIKRLRQLLIPQPKTMKTDVLICSGKSNHSIVVENTTLFSHINASEQVHCVTFEKIVKTDKMESPPSAFACKNNMLERPPPPPKTVILPEIINPIANNMMMDLPVNSWGFEDTKVQHQKQTAFQLLNFLRKDCKHHEVMEVTLIKNDHLHTQSKIQPTPPAMEIKKQQIRHNVTEDVRKSADALPLEKKLLAETEYQAPVFKIKQVNSSGSIIYTCVIATSTELWDIGDIFTEAREDPSAADPLEKDIGKQYQEIHPIQTSTEILSFETQSLQDAEPQRYPAVATTVPVSNHVNIPEFEIKKFEEMEVVVSCIVNPGNFYVQHSDILKQQGLIKDRWNGSSSFAEQDCIPDIGTYVIVFFPKHKQWHRAQVIKICGVSEDDDDGDTSVSVRDIKVEVKKLDYGDTGIVSLRNTKSLPPDMALLPLQAVRVSLAKVTPVDGRDWSIDSVDWFRAMVDNRTLYARFYPEGPTIKVELFLEKGKMGAMRFCRF